ncbi:glycosyltransferase family 4 protein [Polaribacter aestuariivivens]|uniref:Glycosyltransferase family 4 protein n=1 Tax=Polaribacter aestuariivivens TaxID=2304626 RepID=A0A5S3NCG4_9FLAO|nr:glycosyltransferase family 4 protein [Polaribacter aestuariivivens]TMM31349.1 glycosyltransferase family 4 protein [Polaribacter aestuariivivens]
MNTIKTVLLSTASLPHEGVASWTTELNYLLKNDNELDYIIGPYSNIKINKPKQVFIEKLTFLDKIKRKINYNNRFNNYLRALNKVLKLEDKIILQVKDNFGLLKSILFFIEKNKLRKRIYVQYHYHSFSPFTTDEKILSQIDELVLLTEDSYHHMKNTLDTFPVRVSINNDGVDSANFKPVNKTNKKNLREELDLSTDKLIFVWCSQDRKKKGLDIILQVWQEIFKNNNNIELLVFGVQKNINIKGVKIMGLVPNHSLIKYYQCSDFYLFPTIWLEGFGLSLVEALKCGSYCISAENGSTKYILKNGEYGTLVKKPNIISCWVSEIEKAILTYENNNKINPFLKNIPQNIYDIKDWCKRYNNNIIEAKKSFKNRYYI